MSFKFRPQRGSLADSMAECVTLKSRQELVDHTSDYLVNSHGLIVEPYTQDNRVGWDTHIVTLKNYGVLGFTDGPVG